MLLLDGTGSSLARLEHLAQRHRPPRLTRDPHMQRQLLQQRGAVGEGMASDAVMQAESRGATYVVALGSGGDREGVPLEQAAQQRYR